MLNQIILVGRLTREITVNKSDNGVKVATIPLAIPRSFKNSEGGYDTDFIDCVAFDNIALNTKEYCSKGDIIGVKGRVQSRVIEKDDKKDYVIDIIAEKITFLSSHSKEDIKEEKTEENKEEK
jgi:single-strand DNA-binding protein